MARTARHTLLLVAALATAGCLQKQTTHTLYLSADGSVRWIIEESGVYSDESDEGQRLAEEQAYIGPALIGAHRVAQGFQAIAPDGLVRTTVIRDERPFHVVTYTRFFRVDRMLERLFKEAGLKAPVTLEENDGRHRLRMHFDFSRQIEERNSPATALLEDFESFRFVLTEGRFVAGGGFDVPDRREAVISREWANAVETAVSNKREIDLVLTWTGVE
jgi:hypothetical protein